jgi:hypothetical protein
VPLFSQRSQRSRQSDTPPPYVLPEVPPPSEHFRDTQRSAQSSGSYASHTSYCALSVPDPLALQGGWIPVSARQPPLLPEHTSSLRHYWPVIIGALMMTLSIAFFFLRPAVLRPRAVALEATPLVNVPALVRHRSYAAASEERESLGELSRPAKSARGSILPAGSATAEVSEITRKQQECGAPRNNAPFTSESLAGPRHYPGDEPASAPRRTAPVYTPTGI